MAYAAVISLMQTIERLLNLNSSHRTPFLVSSPETINSAYDEVKLLLKILTSEDGNNQVNSLRNFLQRHSLGVEISNNERVKAVETEIGEAACRLEDVLESAHVSHHFLEQSETLDGDQHLPSKVVKEEIDFFIEKVEKIKEQVRNSTSLPPEEHDATYSRSSSRTDHFGIRKSKIFGFDSELVKLKDLLTDNSNKLEIVSVVGMGGIGKTTLTKEVYVDPFIVNYFECSVFVSVGPKYKMIEILQAILDQISPAIDKTHAGSHRELAMYVRRGLKNRKYLIVLDDIWDTQVMGALISSFPDDENGSRIMLTTRIEDVAHFATMNKWEWPVSERSSPERESRDQIVLKVRTKATRHGMLGAGKYLHRVKFLNEKESWHLLREHVFAEGELCPPKLVEPGKKIAEKCEGLPLAIIAVGKHLSKAKRTLDYWTKVAETESSVIIGADEETTNVLYLSYKYLPQYLRACFLYMGVFPHGCEIAASKLIKLWCAEGFLESNSAKTMDNLTMAIFSKTLKLKQGKTSEDAKDLVHKSLAKTSKDFVPKWFKDLLPITLAKTSEDSSMECFKDLKSNSGKTLEDFAKEYLDQLVSRSLVLVCQNSSNSDHGIKTCKTHTTYWHMCVKEAGKDKFFHVINNYANGIRKGVESDAAFASTTMCYLASKMCISQWYPFQMHALSSALVRTIRLDAAQSLSCFDHLSHLYGLQTLKCIVVNPKPSFQVVAPALPPFSVFPSGLKKLTLSGLGLPWEYMTVIAQLPKLEIIKLRHYAFQGPVWKVYDSQFLHLKFLLLEDTDLEFWSAGGFSFILLKHLIISHCYKLKEFSTVISGILSVEMIELVDCSPSLAAAAKQTLEGRLNPAQLIVSSSEDDGKRKS
ncbi:UNVERIFIED_CONTAM: putative late blight resistance proteinR1A-10 [Sesamum calycinum]|uniref:Late blight resistance proteinR1A-10 n=1 Tax=Sesamum calycinum TaxID=2727403 RepID=A0AAW2IUF6_9LAMI